MFRTPAFAVAAISVLVACAGPSPNRRPAPRRRPAPPNGSKIVDRAIEFHGGELFEQSRVKLTVASRSGSFDVDSMADGDRFEQLIPGLERRRRAPLTGATTRRSK